MPVPHLCFHRFLSIRLILIPGSLALLCLLSGGCLKSERMEIKESRKRFSNEKDPEFGVTASQRFLREQSHGGGGGMASSSGKPVNPFRWVTPEGWTEKESSSMRVINLGFGENGEGECYLTALPGDGGGLASNINRWRGQMGLDDLSAEELAALPEKTFLSLPAKFVDMKGDFGGMSRPGVPAAETKSNYRLLGLVQVQEPFTFFIKMVGPADVVAQNEADFHAFCQSITIGAH